MKLLHVTRLALFLTLLVASAQSAERRTSTTTSDGFELEIPEHCKHLGFCDDIPNYPHEQAKKVIEELSGQCMLQEDNLDLPEVPDVTRRVGPAEENIELCKYEEKFVYPKAAVDSDGEWNIVLNNHDDPIQGFKVEICEKVRDDDDQTLALQTNDGEWKGLCSNLGVFTDGYEGRCKQKFVYHRMRVLRPDGSHVKKSLKVPSCCSCVARVVSI